MKDLNRLDAVIGLAPNLFHGTSTPVCLLVLKSKRIEAEKAAIANVEGMLKELGV